MVAHNFLLISVSFLFSVYSHNQLFAQAKSSDVRYQSGDVNLDQSRVFIHVRKTGLGHEHAVEGKLVSGKLHLSESSESVNKSDELVFDMKSFDADGAKARKYVGLHGETDSNTRKQVNANMLGDDVLNVQKFPKATFKPRSITARPSTKSSGDTEYEITGDFTLHGVTQKVSFKAVSTPVKGWMHLKGEFNILQSKYGIKPYSKGFGAIGVADELTIHGDLFVVP